jgi:hypothetical protein
MDSRVAAVRAEVLAIAEGLARDAITPMARQAFRQANACRARATAMRDLDKGLGAITCAATWADILEYLDQAGHDVFDATAYEAARRPPARGWLAQFAGRAWMAVNIAGWVRAWHDLFGTNPVVFYEPPDHGPASAVNE